MNQKKRQFPQPSDKNKTCGNGLYIASTDVSASCAFNFDEWKKFVEGVNK